MALTKNPKFDLKLKSRRIFEISVILSLSLLILAFKYFPEFEKDIVKQVVTETGITVDDIPRTVHEEKKLPPKMPNLIPVEENDDLIDIEIPDTEIEMGTIINSVPPPVDVKEEEEEEAWIFIPVQSPPEIIGGIGAVLQNLEYPNLAKRAGIQGTVVIYAFVDKQGNVAKVEIAKDIGAGCGEAAAKAVMMVKFKPGKQRTKPVKCRVAVPVRFKLN